MKPRQVLDFTRAVTKLTAWLASEGHPPTIEGVTKRIALDYRMAAFVRPGVNPKTANKDISALSSLWKFAIAPRSGRDQPVARTESPAEGKGYGQRGQREHREAALRGP